MAFSLQPSAATGYSFFTISPCPYPAIKATYIITRPCIN